MKRKLAAIVSVAALCVLAEMGRSVLRPYYSFAQDGAIAPAENLIVEGVPAIPASLVETAGRYGSFRNATLADWSPTRREMLIATRFADTAQLHLVKMPGGERQQLTFSRMRWVTEDFIRMAAITLFSRKMWAAESGINSIAMMWRAAM